MPEKEPKYLLIVTARDGLWVRSTPRPQSQGGQGIRKVPVGYPLYAYSKHDIDGVPYARLVPQSPNRLEWVRIKEADGNVEYVDVIELESDSDGDSLAVAIDRLAQSIETLAGNLSRK